MSANIDDRSDKQHSDYDCAWKEAVSRHLSEFFEKLFPELFQLVDWTVEPQWLDAGVRLAALGLVNNRISAAPRVMLYSALRCSAQRAKSSPDFPPGGNAMPESRARICWHIAFRRTVRVVLITTRSVVPH